MVEFKVPLSIRVLYGPLLKRFLKSEAPPISWLHLLAMCRTVYRARHSPVRDEMIEGAYWHTLPQGAKDRWLEDWKQNGTVTALADIPDGNIIDLPHVVGVRHGLEETPS